MKEKQTEDSRRFVAATEIAAYFGVTQQAILQWIRQGRIAALQFGRAYRVPVAEFDKLKRNGLSGAASANAKITRTWK